MARVKHEHHHCDDVTQQLNWVTDTHMICLACGNPMPRFRNPAFTRMTCALVLEHAPGARDDSSLIVLDAVHLDCAPHVPGRKCAYDGFLAVVVD